MGNIELMREVDIILICIILATFLLHSLYINYKEYRIFLRVKLNNKWTYMKFNQILFVINRYGIYQYPIAEMDKPFDYFVPLSKLVDPNKRNTCKENILLLNKNEIRIIGENNKSINFILRFPSFILYRIYFKRINKIIKLRIIKNNNVEEINFKKAQRNEIKIDTEKGEIEYHATREETTTSE